MTHDPSTRSGSLDGLTVLYLPKNSRVAFFQRILSAGAAEFGWTVTVACPPGAERLWSEAIGSSGRCIPVPDITTRQDFEANGETMTQMDAFIHACERTTGVSAGRVLLAGERDLGRGFSRPAYHWFHTQIAKQSLRDPQAPFAMLRRLFAFARQTLQSVKPDIVLAGEWADPMCFAFAMAAREMEIRCVANRPSKLWSGRSFWTDDPMMYNTRTGELAARLMGTATEPSDRARQRISGFRSTPDTLGYVKQNWINAESTAWLAGHGRIARLLRAEVLYHVSGRTGPPPKPALPQLVEHYAKPVRTQRQRRFFQRFDQQALAKQSYIFTALHKDPEQALNYQAPYWANQYATVSLISSTLPAGFRLLVREHRLNTGRRPTRYYQDMARLPGVTLIDAFDDQFKYIANADLVVTDNGSIGWEALLLRRRVITLADTFYGGSGLVDPVDDPENIAELVVNRLERPHIDDTEAHDRALGLLLDAEWETTAPLAEEETDAVVGLLNDLLEMKKDNKANDMLQVAQ